MTDGPDNNDFSGMLCDPSRTLVVETLSVTAGETMIEGHECSDPTHAEGVVEKSIVLVVTDVFGESYYLSLKADGDIVKGMTEMEFYYTIKHLVEHIDD